MLARSTCTGERINNDGKWLVIESICEIVEGSTNHVERSVVGVIMLEFFPRPSGRGITTGKTVKTECHDAVKKCFVRSFVFCREQEQVLKVL